jgi:hypothetical protein
VLNEAEFFVACSPQPGKSTKNTNTTRDIRNRVANTKTICLILCFPTIDRRPTQSAVAVE